MKLTRMIFNLIPLNLKRRVLSGSHAILPYYASSECSAGVFFQHLRHFLFPSLGFSRCSTVLAAPLSLQIWLSSEYLCMCLKYLSSLLSFWKATLSPVVLNTESACSLKPHLTVGFWVQIWEHITVVILFGATFSQIVSAISDFQSVAFWAYFWSKLPLKSG